MRQLALLSVVLVGPVSAQELRRCREIGMAPE